jgi:hypothetical protein
MNLITLRLYFSSNFLKISKESVDGYKIEKFEMKKSTDSKTSSMESEYGISLVVTAKNSEMFFDERYLSNCLLFTSS